MRWITPLVTLGLFCTLCSYAEGRRAGHERKAEPVQIIRAVSAPKCGDDWLCVIAWAEEQKPTKRRKK